MTDIEKLCELGRQVIATEANAIAGLQAHINNDFATACKLCLDCQGRIVVTGMGKSGHIARKIAATFASTGTTAFFVHPAEANHGDMGMFTKRDVVLSISNSGETAEILSILPLIKRLGIPMITFTGKPKSTLGHAADVVLDVSVEEEACPLGLTPTSSTTATLVMGDALAIALLQSRGFTAEDFAMYHPSGNLGQRLLRIGDVMRKPPQIPRVKHDAKLNEALIEMTQKSLGMTTVVDANDKLLGIYTDGDLRRSLSQGLDLHKVTITDVMTKDCKTVDKHQFAAEALQIMETYKITSLVVLDKQGDLQGVVHMHDLLHAGIA